MYRVVLEWTAISFIIQDAYINIRYILTSGDKNNAKKKNSSLLVTESPVLSLGEMQDVAVC